MSSIMSTIVDFDNRIKRIENGIVTDNISYGIVRHYTDWDLWFEAITDTKDGFVMRNKEGEIIGIFQETYTKRCKYEEIEK